MNQQKENNSIFNRFLAGIEYMGNKIPDPMMLFVWLSIITVAASFVLSKIGFSGINPATGEVVTVYNLLSAEGLVRMITTAVSNFTGLSALGMVLVCMLGVGVCDRSGLYLYLRIYVCYGGCSGRHGFCCNAASGGHYLPGNGKKSACRHALRLRCSIGCVCIEFTGYIYGCR